ncbi:hypothetical protein AB3M83_03485 [Microbacterium sp. 179-B 1A2 NHS]|uniref:hypothetical protein n=1 Tax=Microbacterium sp. 179-B 1A2 NHS TaxID=3142383 RepID=UPI0039A2BB2C
MADAVLAYWLTLAEDNRADVVHVPYVTDEGQPSHASITLSPAMVLAALEPGDGTLRTMLDDASALVDIRSRIRSARLPAQAVPCETPPSALNWDEL